MAIATDVPLDTQLCVNGWMAPRSSNWHPPVHGISALGKPHAPIQRLISGIIDGHEEWHEKQARCEQRRPICTQSQKERVVSNGVPPAIDQHSPSAAENRGTPIGFNRMGHRIRVKDDGGSKGIEKQTMWAAYSPGCTESTSKCQLAKAMVAHAYEVPVLPVGPPEIGPRHPSMPKPRSMASHHFWTYEAAEST